MKAPFKANGNALGLKCRQHNDVWEQAIRLQFFVESWGINVVPGHSEIRDLVINTGSLGNTGNGARPGQGFLEKRSSFMGNADLL